MSRPDRRPSWRANLAETLLDAILHWATSSRRFELFCVRLLKHSARPSVLAFSPWRARAFQLLSVPKRCSPLVRVPLPPYHTWLPLSSAKTVRKAISRSPM